LFGPAVTALKVVDASALAALLFAEPEADAVVQRLDGAKLAAPALLPFELANVLVVKQRRHPQDALLLAEAFRLHDRLGVEIQGIDFGETAELALATGLTAYDASYLWLARRLGAELVTLDKALERAAAR
jgi:predicted nucleic acid-binding protein